MPDETRGFLSNWRTTSVISSIEALFLQGEANVIPVLLRPVVFTHFPFASLRPLPTNEKPVVSWRDRDSAFVDIAIGIERAARILLARAIAEEEAEETAAEEVAEEEAVAEEIAEEAVAEAIEEEVTEEELKQAYYERTLIVYERAIQQDTADATAYQGKGHALAGLGRYSEALHAYAQSAALTPRPAVYAALGDVLAEIGRSDDAVTAYQQALALDASYAAAYFGMSQALLQAGRVPEAEQAYARAKQFGDDD
jgi:tetratricopeptide (TPR) repeat protein